MADSAGYDASTASGAQRQVKIVLAAGSRVRAGAEVPPERVRAAPLHPSETAPRGAVAADFASGRPRPEWRTVPGTTQAPRAERRDR